MSNDALTSISTRPGRTRTDQSERAAEGQELNRGGGYSFTVSDEDRIKRFLILGSDASFYTTGAELSKQNAKTIVTAASTSDETSRTLVDLIVDVSTAGRAPKQDPGLFALAIAASHGSTKARAYALSKLPEVARTGSTLLLFVRYVEQFRGWGRALKRAVADWYTAKGTDSVAYQAVKYRQRNGFSHRDTFRLSHPQTSDPALQGLGEWILRGDASSAPQLVKGFELAQTASVKELPAIINTYGLTWEMLPSEALNSPEVWTALLDGNVPLTALIRQLPRLTTLGIIRPLGGHTNAIVERLTDRDALLAARIHPLNILVALKTYAGGHSLRGDGAWVPVQQVVDALDKAFYLSFESVIPTGKSTLIGLDVSGSMHFNQIAGLPLTPAEAVAALALVTASVETNVAVMGFSSTFVNLPITPRMRLDDVMRVTSNLPFSWTDCSLPMRYALENKLAVETFIIMTDNDTNHGTMHPHEALEQYRAASGIDAKLIVLSTDASEFSIANPNDPGMLDIAGFDTSAPALISAFSKA